MEEVKADETAKKHQKLISDSEKSDSCEVDEKDQKDTLYHLLNVTRTATLEEIKKQYKVLALKLHPDKNQGTDEAKENFQKMNEAYQILCDPRKRKLYDETGLIEDGNMDDFEAAYNFFRSIYKKIEQEDIINFEAKYKNSKEEIEDLIAFYNKNQGNISLILEEIILSENSDIDRFLQIYDKLIEEGTIQHYKQFDKTRNEIKLLKNEIKKINKRTKQKQEQNFKGLQEQILAKYNNGNPNMFLEQLESRYSNPKSKKKSGKQQKKLIEEEEKVIQKHKKVKKYN